jgi:hypothetical protein
MTFDDHKEDAEESNPNRSPDGAPNPIREAILQAQVKRSRNRRAVAQQGQQSSAWDALKQRLVSARITEAFASPKFFMNGKKFTALRTLGEGGYSTVFEVRVATKMCFFGHILHKCSQILQTFSRKILFMYLYLLVHWTYVVRFRRK